MKFYALLSGMPDVQNLAEEYQKGREIGSVCVGEEHLFFRAKLKKYYIPYTAVDRCYRRVFLVPAKMCCGSGDFQMENLVICSKGKELAQIPLPGTRAARELMKVLQEKMPDAQFASPESKSETTV